MDSYGHIDVADRTLGAQSLQRRQISRKAGAMRDVGRPNLAALKLDDSVACLNLKFANRARFHL